MAQQKSQQQFDNTAIIYPKPLIESDNDTPHLKHWGFADTKFTFVDKNKISITGKRYTLSNKILPGFIPWVNDALSIEVDETSVAALAKDQQIPKPIVNEKFYEKISHFFSVSQITQQDDYRIRHSHGHTLEDVFAVSYGDNFTRIVDMVVYPETDEQVNRLVAVAEECDVCLIPYGGGTNVTLALQCVANETRMIISVDMSHMNKVLWIDPVNHTACIQAGAVGRHIVKQLKYHGFTLGHEPDSLEFSTLGGWIATNASGMKKNRYGNIEDIVQTVDVVSLQGHLARRQVTPRESIGLDYKRLFIGSEGNLGIITSAVVKINPLPAVEEYDAVIFPNFDNGFQFLYDLTKTGVVPASIRLVDNDQFQFSLALKEQKSTFKRLKSKFEEWIVTKIKHYDPKQMVVATIVYEGSESEVATQKKVIHQLMKQYRGMRAGAENGKRGYQLTFSIAYIRDFLLTHHILGESFETAVPWRQVNLVCEQVKATIARLHEKHDLPGRPFVSFRITQLYTTGVCIYFYFGFYYKGVEDPLAIYRELEDAARDTILQYGGSLSHHHGVGKIRQQFLPEIMSYPALKMIEGTKQALDPKNIFGCNNYWCSQKVSIHAKEADDMARVEQHEQVTEA